MTGELLAAALRYASAGWPVFPCTPDGTAAPDHKAPLTAHGFKDATTDPARIRAWWHRWPDANVAIATGEPGPDVLDVDNHDTGRSIRSPSAYSNGSRRWRQEWRTLSRACRRG